MNKFRAKPITIDGIRFASQLEGKRYGQLKLLQIAGAITGLVCHPKWELVVNDVRIGSYSADFLYTLGGAEIVEDVKSSATKTAAYMLRVRLLKAIHGLDVIEVDNRGKRKAAFTLPKRPKRASGQGRLRSPGGAS